MTAPSKNWTAILDTAIAAGKPLDEPLLTALRDNLVHLEEWLGHSYTAARNHNHDGVNSALISVGPNMVRNYGFEEDLTGWTQNAYSGGSIAISTSNDLEGAKSVGITSANVTNGGGYVQSGTLVVAGGLPYRFGVSTKASTPGMSSDSAVIWFNRALTQIGTTGIHSVADTPTTFHSRVVMAPQSARYAVLRITGGVPGLGSSAGTVYFDNAFAGVGYDRFTGAGNIELFRLAGPWTWGTTAETKVAEIVCSYAGSVRVRFDLRQTGGGTVGGRIFVNDVVRGTDRQTASSGATTYTEDILIDSGDRIALYLRQVAGSPVANAENFILGGNAPLAFAQN
jgi:hypothetical protein